MIRNANKKDLKKIADLWLQMSSMHENLDESFRLKHDARERFRNYASNVIEDKNKLTIVFEDREVLGYLFAEIINQPPVYYEEKIGFISEISVDTNKRRTGIGEKLLKYSENWFREEGAKRIDCQVAAKNPVSTTFWEKHGYVEHSRICSKLI